MTMHFRELAQQAAADGVITPKEILSLRRAGWGDGQIMPEEAEAIFIINDRIAVKTPEWSDFFVEALGEFIVNGTEPRGYVDDSQAVWLVERVDHDGACDSMTELELLVRVIEKAMNVPQVLKDYVLKQIEQAVLDGVGPTRAGGSLEKGNVNATEASLLRRVIFAQAGDQPAAVSQHETEMLFRLKDRTLAADNAPEWKRLFVQGVGNFLQGYSSYKPLETLRAAELESFMNDTTPHMGRFAARMAGANIGEGFRTVFGKKKVKQMVDLSSEVMKAEEVTLIENTWLQGQIHANDVIDDYDQALLDFLREA